MNHRSATLCQTAIVDHRSHNISLINVIDQINLDRDDKNSTANDKIQKKVVLVPFSAQFVIYSDRTCADQPELCKGRILIKDPEEQEVGRTFFEVDLTKYKRTRNIVQFNVFPFVAAGTYRLEVQYQDVESENWIEVDSVPLDVLVQVSTEPEPVMSK